MSPAKNRLRVLTAVTCAAMAAANVTPAAAQSDMRPLQNMGSSPELFKNPMQLLVITALSLAVPFYLVPCYILNPDQPSRCLT